MKPKHKTLPIISKEDINSPIGCFKARAGSERIFKRIIPVLFIILALFITNQTYGQVMNISGKVIEAESGESMPAVNIFVKGKGTRGTISDADGNYNINVEIGDTLIYSFVGYLTKEVSVSDQVVINVEMVREITEIDELVVVGYASVRKANLTGSVDNVSGEELIRRPAINSINILQGQLTGVEVVQSSAEPGRTNPSIMIRGRGSYGGSNAPLILIDGVSGSLSTIAPSDIESVTVLKDAASASIYGARAANGVILVTTKKGKKGKPVISYRGNLAIHSPTRLPDFVSNSVEYMEMWNKAAPRGGNPFRYSAQNIDDYRNATDREKYPNFNSVDYWFRNALVHDHGLSVAGGGESSLYNVSINYLDQEAMLPGYKYRRYNALLNYSNDIKKWLTLGTTINGTYTDQHDPPFTSVFLALMVYAAGPTYGPYLPDGSGRAASRAYNMENRNRNVSEAYEMGYQDTKKYNLNPQFFVDIRPFKGLIWTTKFAFNYTDEFYKMHQVPYDAFLTQEMDPSTGDYRRATYGPDIKGVTDQYSKRITPTLYSVATYNTNFREDHNFAALAGYEQISYKVNSVGIRRSSSVAPALSELRAYEADGQLVNFTHPRLPGLPNPEEWAMQSLFGRINYGFKSKYLFEANLRYDGTSKVSPDYRWGLFPSVSGAWVLSEEDFIGSKVSWLSNLKLRASYGILGNQDIGTYLYQDVISIDEYYWFSGRSLTQGAVVNSFRDKSLRWESTRISDFGFDLSIKNGLFGMVFDWFDKYTYDILAQQPVPASVGLSSPTSNDGKMRNRGFEVDLIHRYHIGNFVYNAYFNLSHYKNELVYIRVPSYGSTIRENGLPYESHYLYIWDGIFQESDLTDPNVPVHALNPNPQAGDLKMKDIDGDGDVDPDDRQVVDGAYPDFIYSFGVNMDYKGWHLSLFFQGVEGRQSRANLWGIDPFNQGTPPTKKWRDAWTPENQSNTLPALYISGYPGVTNYSASTYYLQDASYLRLKNVMLSYTFPVALMNRIRCEGLTVFFSGDNLLTFTDFEGQDPERSLTSYQTVFASYPQARIFNFGLNVKF